MTVGVTLNTSLFWLRIIASYNLRLLCFKDVHTAIEIQITVARTVTSTVMTTISGLIAAVLVLHRHRHLRLPVFARVAIRMQTTVPPSNPAIATTRTWQLIVAALVRAITPHSRYLYNDDLPWLNLIITSFHVSVKWVCISSWLENYIRAWKK